ncbi:cytoplasmic dynein with WD40 domain [Coelomomyces lativittatus]|nr:cytoplasmic dynein with WD40 domain [Coelomomyces lativittatus]KAJ1516496.1 cytoplasmic dynein with WD40 domain [Coelomomyces lativittatus]KAJ1517732.1 cytoplasmic dynein with WD40 domain [Coelomomyces lativittatus]
MKSIRRSKLSEQGAIKDIKGSTNALNSASQPGPPGPDTLDPNLNSEWLPPKQLLKPLGQLTLTEKELDEEVTRILNANNPHAPQNIARWNNKEQMYKASPIVEHMCTHFDFGGYLTFKGEDKKLFSEDTNKADAAAVLVNSSSVDIHSPTPGELEALDDKKMISRAPARNQFNYSERATQSVNNALRSRSSNTEPPPHKTFSEAVNQWAIYDAYVDDAQAKEKAVREKNKNASGKGHKEDDKQLSIGTEATTHSEDIYHSLDFQNHLHIVERMSNQNTFDAITQDFKYWDDAADELRESKEGTLLPLWNFSYEKDKKKQVTALVWNPNSSDLFAVAFGSYNFSKQGPGVVCCFSLKNPSYPEFIHPTHSGIMAIDFHPKRPHMLALGLYDGTCMVLDYASKIMLKHVADPKHQHMDSVWQVAWQPDDLDGNANFFSVGGDGYVKQAVVLKNELMMSNVIKLELQYPLTGLCFDFDNSNNRIFIVGTEEGKLVRCSKDYNSKYLDVLDVHDMAVYRVLYNKFFTQAFLTTSADWTVKLWDQRCKKPILIFDFGCPVGDIAWAPYSSTVFAVVTSDGKVVVFDLDSNKYEPLCTQQVVTKAKLTRLAFNPFEPVILVGDDKGLIQSLKLSPNLRRCGRGGNVQSFDDQREKLEKIVLLSMGKDALGQ